MAVESELESEQAFVDAAYERLDAMRADARAMMDGVLDVGRGGTFQSRTERDVIVRTSLARLEALDIGDQALTFGRIDRRDDGEGGPVETFHIGRLAVHGADQEPMVVDWRAPVAEPFYRATGRDPQGLVLRRHLAVKGREVLGIEDEIFEGDAVPAADARPAGGESSLVVGEAPLGGPASLLAALSRARTGAMVDIVATIQSEQDAIIRSPLAGMLAVQGGPGTGKTAVALHRAAYLLYTHRFPLERQGVLVVGPNPLFLRYIEQVLPSLGETGVTLSTVSGLVPEIRVRSGEDEHVAALKGDARMAKVIARAVRTRQRPLSRDASIPFGTMVLRVTRAMSRDVVEAAKHRSGSHNARRRWVEATLSSRLASEARRLLEAREGGGRPTLVALPGSDGDVDSETDLRDVARRIAKTPAFGEVMDRIWPRLSPHEMLHDLLGAPPLIAVATKGLLTEAEAGLLHRPRSASLDAVAWTAADAALVDEARAMLGPRSGGSDDPVRTFGHIVVDEVQDLSPMQLRMLARRSLSGSMTIVGDIAQGTSPGACSSWGEIERHLPTRRGVERVELTVSYRTPAEVLDVAAGVLAVTEPGLEPPRPVRRTGTPARFVAVPASDDLVGALVRVVAENAADIGEGRTALLVPGARRDELLGGLVERGVGVVDPRESGRGGLYAPLVLLAAEETNGLEFDAVVVVEPAEIVAGSDRGMRVLYVAMTRPTRRLVLVHGAPLPAPLEEYRAR